MKRTLSAPSSQLLFAALAIEGLGTFPTRAAAEKHERAVQFFKRRH